MDGGLGKMEANLNGLYLKPG